MIKKKSGVVVIFQKVSDYHTAKHLVGLANPPLEMEPDGVDTLFFVNGAGNLLSLQEYISVILSGMNYTMKNVW